MIPLVNPAISRQAAGPQPWLHGAVRWIVVVLALVATLDAAYMTWSSFTHGVVAGCGPDTGGCHEVLTSKWSRAAGLPVALGGLVCYGGILGLALFAGSREFNSQRWLGTVLATLAALAAFAGLWFTGLQVIALGTFCYYCLATHLCGLVIAGLVLWSAFGANSGSSAAAARSHASLAAIPGAGGVRRPAVARPAAGPSLFAAIPTAAGLVALLIAVQVIFPAKTFSESKPNLTDSIDMTAAKDPAEGSADDELSPDAQPYTVNRVGDGEDASDAGAGSADVESEETELAAQVDVKPKDEKSAATEADEDESETAEEPPKLTREVKFLGGKLKINMYDEAVLGSPEAEHVVIELMDYTCPHCRKMHAHIQEARERYGDQLAVVIMPVPLELECNKLVGETDPMHRGACKLAKLSLAVAKADQSKFGGFHNFLLHDEEKPPTSAQAVSRAFRLLGRKKLTGDNSSNAPQFAERLQKYIRLYQNLSAQQTSDKTFGLPVQIVGDTLLNGGDMTEEEMFTAWEKALNIQPQ
jgi:uncharacterized membrane protein/protein-disulfide isomerase